MIGPTKLILIHAGKYEYGEVDLTAPLHLVGPNNIGKTTLVNALQFLYVDSKQQMQFGGWSMSETLEYYFPSRYSYVLFECLTREGRKVVGVRGLGVTHQYDYERFAYESEYRRVDFIDEEGAVREPDTIKARLAANEYRTLKPKHLRAALTGLGDNKGMNLGLLPFKQRDGYTRFKFIFRNLLRLSRLRQDALKDLLCEIHEDDFHRLELDLKKQYEAEFERVGKLTGEVERVEQLVPLIEEILRRVDERAAIRERLPALWVALHEAHDREEEALGRRLATLSQKKERLQDERSALDEERRRLREREGRLNEKKGEARGQIKGHEKARAEFEGFAPDEVRARCSAIEAQLERLRRKLAGVDDVSLQALADRRDAFQRKIEAFRRRIRRFGHLAGSYLVERFTEDELDRMFRIINPALLGLAVDGGEVAVKDEPRLSRELRALHAKVRGAAFETEGVRIDLEATEPPALGEYVSEEAVRETIEAHTRELARIEARIEAAERKEELEAQVRAQEQERDDIRDRLRRYRRFLERADEIEALRGEVARLDEEIASTRQAVSDREETMRELERAVRHVEGEVQKLKERRQQLRAAVGALDEPPEGASAEAHRRPREADVEPLIEAYAEQRSGFDARTEEIRRRLSEVERMTYSRMGSGPEEEAIERLRQEHDGVQEKRAALQKAWRGLTTGLSRAFSDLLADLEELKGQVTAINRRLAQTTVSDLRDQRLTVAPQQGLVRLLEEVVRGDEQPLFADLDRREEAMARIREILTDHPSIHLKDLFTVQFEVRQADGEKKVYDDLDTIQSNGTSITLKVLTNLILLSRLLRDDRDWRLPFYLDEASSADSDNLQAIIRQAGTMGFTPILASPDPVEAAPRIYWPQERNGRVYLGEEHRMDIHVNGADA